METPTLIFCAGGNATFAEIAIGAGFKFGAQLPKALVYYPIYFADQDWKRPDRAGYMAALARHRPAMATVLDWERKEQLPEVLSWAEEAAQYVEQVLLIPKVIGGIASLPRCVGGADIVLGYSVPTRYGGTSLPFWSFAGWPVHLLGGSPHCQMKYWRYMVNVCDVISADGSMSSKMATTRCQFWTSGTARYARDRWWPSLSEAGFQYDGSGPAEAFRRSCENVMAAWRGLAGE